MVLQDHLTDPKGQGDGSWRWPCLWWHELPHWNTGTNQCQSGIATHGSRLQVARTGNPQEDDWPDENMGGNDTPLDNPSPKGRGSTWVPPGGEGKAGQGSSDIKEMRNIDHKDDNKQEEPKESSDEDPVNGQTGKEYTPRTKKGQECLLASVASWNPVPTP